MVIAFAVLSVPLGVLISLILGFSTIVSFLRFLEGGAEQDALNALVSGALFATASLGVLKLVKWLRK
jgi:hypothetical protein